MKKDNLEFSLYDDETITLCLAGDTGGEFTKLGVYIVNCKKSNSVFNLSLIGIYRGKDTMINLRTAFGDVELPKENDIWNISGKCFKIKL